MSIRKLNENGIGSNSYWSILSRASRNIYEKTNNFPIKYGHLSEHMKLDIAPVKITNGTHITFPYTQVRFQRLGDMKRQDQGIQSTRQLNRHYTPAKQ